MLVSFTFTLHNYVTWNSFKENAWRCERVHAIKRFDLGLLKPQVCLCGHGIIFPNVINVSPQRVTLGQAVNYYVMYSDVDWYVTFYQWEIGIHFIWLVTHCYWCRWWVFITVRRRFVFCKMERDISRVSCVDHSEFDNDTYRVLRRNNSWMDHVNFGCCKYVFFRYTAVLMTRSQWLVGKHELCLYGHSASEGQLA